MRDGLEGYALGLDVEAMRRPTETLAVLIRRARDRAGWTQVELAKRAGLADGNHVAMIEQGRRVRCAAKTLIGLARTLNLDPATLMIAASRKA